MNVEDILKSLEGLDKADFDIHVLNDAWYSEKALTRALGNASEEIPAVTCVRIGLSGGMLELHPVKDEKLSLIDCPIEQKEKVQILCYCCFGGDPEKGLVTLSELKEKILSLKDHDCPPWPG